MRDLFAGRRAALGTKHEKERVIAPILEDALGLEVFVPNGFDSDRFGTFTREVPRAGSQLEAARAKARAAMALTGASIGIASEGSFGTDPAFPLLPSNLELIVLIDREQNLEIRGEYRGGACVPQGARAASADEAVRIARAWGFPEHGVIVRLSARSRFFIHKEARTEEALRAAVARLLRLPFVRSVWLENDLRAHRNPTRMEAIRHAAEDLARRCATPCPRCARPGFGPEAVVPGAPCGACGAATDLPKARIYRCPSCAYEEERPEGPATADPASCARCNP